MAALSAILLALSFPPTDIAPLAWIATIPWMLALARGCSARVALLSAAVHSGLLHVICCAWMVGLMRGQGGLSLPVALVTYAIGAITVLPFSVLPALALSSLSRRIGAWAFLLMAPAWVLVDITRARMVLGFPWYIQGMTQAHAPSVLGVADLGGVHAVSLLVLLGNAAIASVAWMIFAPRDRTRSAVAALVAGVLVAAALVHGVRAKERHAVPEAGAMRLVLPSEAGLAPSGESPTSWHAGGSLSVALVQGAVPQEVVLEARPDEDEARARLQLRLSALALSSGARVIVWSESAYPATFTTAWPMRELEASLAAQDDGPEAIIGGLADVWPAPGAPRSDYTLTNSAVLVDSAGPKGRYDKRYLVPFGEYLPAKWFFFWFKQLTRTVGNLRAGSGVDPLRGDGAAYGTFICYEAVLPQHVREISAAGSSVLVNITNDGWFHGSAVPEQHLRFAILRAVESRKWLLRCANSGISAIIAPDGRVVGRLEEGERGVLLSSVAPSLASTPYLRFGDAPLTQLGVLVAIATLAALIADQRERREASQLR